MIYPQPGVQEQVLKTVQQRKQAENTKKSVFNIHPCPDVDFTDDVWNIMKGIFEDSLSIFKRTILNHRVENVKIIVFWIFLLNVVINALTPNLLLISNLIFEL